MNKIVAIDHAVLTLRIVGNPAAYGYDKPQNVLESLSDADFDAHISTVQSAIGSHNRLEVNEVLRRKTNNGWQLFQVIPLRTQFNDSQAPTSATTEYVFVKYAAEVKAERVEKAEKVSKAKKDA